MTLHTHRISDSTDRLLHISTDLADSVASLMKRTAYELDGLRWQWRKTEYRIGKVELALHRPANDVVRSARRFAGELRRSYLRMLATLR